MTNPLPDGDRPEPVVDYARLAGLLCAALLAVIGVVRLVLDGQAHDLTALEVAVNGALTAGGALAAYLLPVWQARKARAKVTPLEDPRTADGVALIPAGTGYVVDPQIDGRPDHAAPE